MRVVVAGGGVIGLLTAVECVRAGASVELIDQGGIPAPLATSNDRYRVVRALHRGDAGMTRAAARGRREWAELERLLGVNCYLRTGVLTVMPAAAVADNLALLGAAGETGLGPPFGVPAGSPFGVPAGGLRVAAGSAAVFEPEAGAVLASEALTALAAWLRARPAVTMRENTRVVSVSESGAVRLADGSIADADAVVIAVGPWSRDVLPAPVAGDLLLYRQTMLTYEPGPAWKDMPAVLGLGPEHDAWLMPPAAGTPARLSAASACRAVPAMSGRAAPARWRDHLVSRFAGLLADFDPGRVTGAADGYYLADPVGLGPRVVRLGTVWAYAACGGLSFKIAPLMARALADRAMGRPPRATGLESRIPGLTVPWPSSTRKRDEAART